MDIVLDQWVNLQFQLDRTQGYELRLFDGFRNLKETQAQKVLLPVQNPEPRFRLVQNIRGYVKSIMVY